MDLSQMSNEDLLALKSGDLSKVSAAGLQTLKASHAAASQPAPQGYQSPGESPQGSTWQNAKARLTDPNRYKAVLGMDSPAQPNVVQGDAPLVLPGAALPKAAAFAAKLAEAPGIAGLLGRTGANAAVGGAQGAMEKPDTETQGSGVQWGDRAYNALTGAGAAAAASPLMEGVSKLGGVVADNAPQGLKTFLGKLAGMSEKGVTDYAHNPEMADEMSRLQRDAPEELNQHMQDMVGDALKGPDSLYEQSSKPLMEQMNTKLVGKSIRVNPGQFKDSAAAGEIQGAIDKNPPAPIKLSVPVEPAPSQDPTDQFMTANARAAQKGYNRPSYGTNQGGRRTGVASGLTSQEQRVPPVPPQSFDEQQARLAGAYLEQRQPPSTGWSKAPLLPNDPIPPQQVEVPAPAPEQFSLTPQQALRAARSSGDAAYGKKMQAQAGVGIYNSSSDPDALAAHNLREAIRGVGGDDAAKIMDQLSENSRQATQAQRLFGSNPSRVLSNGQTSLGQVPARSTRKFLDQNLGTNFEELANALSSGNEMNSPDKVNGLGTRLFHHYVGKPLVSNYTSSPLLELLGGQGLQSEGGQVGLSDLAKGIGEAVKSGAYPGGTQTLLNVMLDKNK